VPDGFDFRTWNATVLAAVALAVSSEALAGSAAACLVPTP